MVLAFLHKILGSFGLFDPPLLALSAMVCAMGSYTVFTCFGRALLAQGSTRWLWISVVCISFGADLWAAHFIAMLAYLPALSYSFDVEGTVFSILIATFGCAAPLGYLVSNPQSRAAIGFAGISLGLTIAATHLVGLHALKASRSVCSPGFDIAGFLFAAALSGLAVGAAGQRRKRYSLILSSCCLALAIFGLYFIAMAGFSIDADLPGSMPSLDHKLFDHRLLAPLVNAESLGLAIASLSGLVLVATFSAAVADRRIGALQANEANKLRYQMRHDETTRLPNRLFLREALLSAGGPEGRGLALVMIDLDRFKPVNDLFGRETGDRLLALAAARMQSLLVAPDIIARIGGDKFVIMRHGKGRPEDAFTLAKQVIAKLTENFIVNGQTIGIGASAGIAVCPPGRFSPETLLQDAETALQHARAAGGGQPCLFESAMRQRQELRRQMECDFRQAIEDRQFCVHYQPLFVADTLGLIGFEALVRWEHPARGMISPAEFIPFAEKSGLITPLGLWVLETACAEAVRWPDHVRISINISPVQLKTGDLVNAVAAALQKTGLPPHRLELEVTEGALIENPEQARAILSRLKTTGVQITIDDFGTGYSSLSYLRHFPFDRIKIDRSFIRDLESDSDSLAIVRAVINLGHSLRVGVLAEGVETAGQLQLLRKQNCDQLQGFLLGRPGPLASAAALVKAKASLFEASIAGMSSPRASEPQPELLALGPQQRLNA